MNGKYGFKSSTMRKFTFLSFLVNTRCTVYPKGGSKPLIFSLKIERTIGYQSQRIFNRLCQNDMKSNIPFCYTNQGSTFGMDNILEDFEDDR